MLKRDVQKNLLKALSASILFEDLQRFLPFQTRVVGGHNFNHLQYLGAYDIKTYGKPSERFAAYAPEYTVSEGDTLCRRSSPITYRNGVNDENCPGCLSIAQGIIKRDIENA